MGVGIVFRIQPDGAAVVDRIEAGSPAADSDVRPGDVLWRIGGKDVERAHFQDMAEVIHANEVDECAGS